MSTLSIQTIISSLSSLSTPNAFVKGFRISPIYDLGENPTFLSIFWTSLTDEEHYGVFLVETYPKVLVFNEISKKEEEIETVYDFIEYLQLRVGHGSLGNSKGR